MGLVFRSGSPSCQVQLLRVVAEGIKAKLS
jgi:hypothetical protein